MCTHYFNDSIINSFERIIDALINQDNFTNITVVENDIALKGESVSLLLSFLFDLIDFL